MDLKITRNGSDIQISRCKSTHVLQGKILWTWLDTKSTLNGCDFGCNFDRPTSGKNNYIYVKRLFIYICIYIYNLYIYIYNVCICMLYIYTYLYIESNKYIMNIYMYIMYIISIAPLGLSHHLTSELRVDPGLDTSVPELLSSPDAARVHYINYICV